MTEWGDVSGQPGPDVPVPRVKVPQHVLGMAPERAYTAGYVMGYRHGIQRAIAEYVRATEALRAEVAS